MPVKALRLLVEFRGCIKLAPYWLSLVGAVDNTFSVIMALAAAVKRCASSALFHRSLSLPEFRSACPYHKKVRVTCYFWSYHYKYQGLVKSFTVTYVAGNFLAWLLMLMLFNSCTCKQVRFTGNIIHCFQYVQSVYIINIYISRFISFSL